ncbi:hypothetical protein NV379_01730 [Paenibacillus sp. N1-5-1-14]|uniref:hypothetical protein n=1 Tax=Paenibacillus radicibacter TaxID=2972488 RepID=UPI00215948E3|nr:hypothetical protein [Paenibacillus radicibacter]MCR8641365.1 hypothetical protein [Paenibacillus radicibacter]
MNLDRFNENFFWNKFPIKDEPEEFSTCANNNCRKTLYIGDEALEHYGYVCCKELDCLIAVSGSKDFVCQNDEE